MRIRKHASISALLLAGASSSYAVHLQPHVCQLNQSPWDVPTTTFSPPSTPTPPPPPPSTQVNHENVISGIKEISADSISPVKREECDVVKDVGKWDSSDSGLTAESDEPVVMCCKTVGKSWRCGREAVEGAAMCEHHLTLAKNHNTNSTTHSTKKKAAAVVVQETTKCRPRTKTASSSNPYDFYYYSGFGPRWGKKRGEDHHKDIGSTTSDVPKDVVEEKPVPLSSLSVKEIDYMDDEDEDEEEEEELYKKRKRARKPIKARSLKSIIM